MIVASCTLCTWSMKTKGVWDCHFRTRNHFQQKHPKEYQEILDGESEAHQVLNRLRAKYGQAVTRHF